MDFASLPKVELHLHLDCSLSYKVVHTIDATITHAHFCEAFIAPAKCTDLVDFLKRAPQGVALMQTERNLRLVTDDLFDQLVQDGVIYAEIRFAPLLHTDGDLSADEVVGIVAEATAQAGQRTGVEARLILCTLRHYSEAQSLQTIALVERFRGTVVAGFDIAADEAGYPIDAHIAAFQQAVRSCIPCTAHAGEARGADSIWETLEHLRPSRIGHGVRSIEDPRLLDHLRRHNIHLEVCPSSNIQVNVYETYADHPIPRLYDAGLSLGINTDARTITNITLTREYERLHETFGWEKSHFYHCNLHALQAAFLSDTCRDTLINIVQRAYG